MNINSLKKVAPPAEALAKAGAPGRNPFDFAQDKLLILANDLSPGPAGPKEIAYL